MSIWQRFKFLLPFYRRAQERDMQEELDSLAAIAGRRELGNLTLAAERARAEWGWGWLTRFVGDLRYAFRVLRKRPSFSAVAVLSLALGIGANAAIFSLIDTLLIRSLPVHDPEGLVTFEGASGSYSAFRRFQADSRKVLSSVLATTGVEARDLDAGGGPRQGYAEMVSGNYFEVLGVTAATGRTITEEDDRRDAPGLAAVISYGYWQTALGGDPGVLGKTLRVQRTPFTIVGVAPPEFFGVRVGQAPDVWLPVTTHDQVFPGRRWLENPQTSFLALLGRLRPGITPAQAADALTPLKRQIDIDRGGPSLPAWIRKQIDASDLSLKPAGQGLSTLRQRFAKPLWVVFGMVATVLLLVCVNLLSLQLARTHERRRELSVRLAIGADRVRIVQQLFTEALTIAVAGGLIGLAISRPAAAAISTLISQGGVPVKLELRIDSTMLLFVFGLSVLAALVCGVAPALQATRGNLAPALQQGSRSTATPIRRVLGKAVTSIQFALSLVLVAAAFLFAFSLYKLTHFETGVTRRHLVMADVDTREAGYRGADQARLNRRILERLAGLPGVEFVSFSGQGIYSRRNSNTQMGVDGFQGPSGPERSAFFDEVGPRYFRTIGAHLVAGRDFDDRDTTVGARVAIVNEEFVKHFFDGKSPIGRNIYRYESSNKDTYEVVGVVRNIRSNVRQAPRRDFYLPSQGDLFTTRFLVRTKLAPKAIFGDLRAEIRGEDASLRIASIDSADQLLDRTLDLDRLIAVLSLGFGVLALTLAAVGVYGRLAYEVTQRKGEIGIRMAIGANRFTVIRLVVREIALVAAVGVAAGTVAAVWIGRLATSLVFEVEPLDPRVLGAAAVLLVATAVSAALIPAWKAALTDPMTALRNE